MAADNSSAYVASGSTEGNSGDSNIFGVFRRKWEKVQDVIQGFTSPLKRHSMYEELPEHVWPQEHIEVSRVIQQGLGHSFLPCQLSNPTWCDYCGDFIWGIDKQCLRCQICLYTCHQHCLSSVTLNCKSVSSDGCDIITPTTPSPSNPRSFSETVGNIHARPGSAMLVAGTGSGTRGGAQQVSELIPNCQQSVQGMGRGAGIHPEMDHGYMGTPKASGLSMHHRSVSENFVTAHSFHMPHSGLISQTPAASPEQLISSQPYLSSCSDNQVCSHHHQTSSRHSQPNSVLHCSHSDSTSGDTIQDYTNVNNKTRLTHHIEHVDHTTVELPKDNAILVFPDVSRADDETNPDVTNEKDETDSGYRSGTIPDDKLPRVPSQTTLDQQELQRKVAKYNHFVPVVSLEVTGKESFQGFLKVTMNLIRPITMELGARPPSIYELLTKEHIIDENTQQVAFYMPRDTHKSLHITSDTTTKEVIASLLKKFHILDHPRKFALYDQEFSDRNKLVCLRRLTDKDFPLRAMVNWDPERMKNYRMVLQENETGEIVWDAFSLPELNNFLKVLDREEKETVKDLRHKYAFMKQYMDRRIIELRAEKMKNKT